MDDESQIEGQRPKGQMEGGEEVKTSESNIEVKLRGRCLQ